VKNVPFTVLLLLPSQGDLGQGGAELPAEPRARREPEPRGRRSGGEAPDPGGDPVPAAELGGGSGDAGAAQLPEGVPGGPGRRRPLRGRLLAGRARERVRRQQGVAAEPEQRVEEGELPVAGRVRRVHHPREKRPGRGGG
jgi:hypothetical protein